MDKYMAREKIKQVTKEIIESLPYSDLMILADLLVDALMEEINEHINDTDGTIISYEIY